MKKCSWGNNWICFNTNDVKTTVMLYEIDTRQATRQRRLQQETKVSWKTVTTLNQQGQGSWAKARNNKQRKVLGQSPLSLTLNKSVAASISLNQPCSPAKLQACPTCMCCSQPTAFGWHHGWHHFRLTRGKKQNAFDPESGLCVSLTMHDSTAATSNKTYWPCGPTKHGHRK